MLYNGRARKDASRQEFPGTLTTLIYALLSIIETYETKQAIQ